MKILNKLGRRLLEPSSVAGYAGVPTVGVIASVVFPQFAVPIAIGSAAVGGLLVGRKEEKTLRADGFIKVQ